MRRQVAGGKHLRFEEDGVREWGLGRGEKRGGMREEGGERREVGGERGPPVDARGLALNPQPSTLLQNKFRCPPMLGARRT